MNKFVLTACAAVVGVAAFTAADASAARTPRQSFRWAGFTNRLPNQIAYGQWSSSVSYNQIAVALAQPSYSLRGTTQTGLLIMSQCPDPRTMTAAEIRAKTFNPTTGLIMSFAKVRNPSATRLGEWATDEDNAAGGTLRWRSFNPTTRRLTGTLAATLVPGAESPSQANYRVRGGTFNIEVQFNEVPTAK